MNLISEVTLHQVAFGRIYLGSDGFDMNIHFGVRLFRPSVEMA